MLRNKIAIIVLIISMAFVCYKRITSVTWGPTVTTNSGGIRGIVETSRDGREYFSWLGIPYAQPPIGSLRFASPVPVKKWAGVRDGDTFGSVCPQTFILSPSTSGSEDCLFLNVYAPKVNTNRPLPVLVFIHGGAFVIGSADMMNPSYFMDEDVIIITLNYRLNVMGFLTTGDSNIRGNMGLKDQALALKWVKDNVENFGGDPNEISIFGISAGAASVHYLTLSPSTKGLFKKAISMSGTSILPWAFSTTQAAIEKSKDFARDLNCPTENSGKMADCLRALDVSELLVAYKKHGDQSSLLYPSRGGLLFEPTVETVDDDEAFLAKYPYDVIREGKAHRIPWMSGVCRDEGLLSSFEFYRDTKALDIVENHWDKAMQNSFYLSPAFSPQEAADAMTKLRDFYFPDHKSYPGATANESEREVQISKYTKMFSDGLFLVGPSVVAEAQKQFSPVYLYIYTKSGVSPGLSNVMANIQDRYHPILEIILLMGRLMWQKYVTRIPFRVYGVAHAEDGGMFFPLFSFMAINKDDPNYQLSKDMVRLFVQFAKNDEENALQFRDIKFTPNKGKGPLMYLEVDDDPRMIPEPFAERTEFWKSINYSKLFSSKK